MIANVLYNAPQKETACHDIDNQPFKPDGTLFVQFIVIVVVVGTAANIFIDRFDVLTASYYHVSVGKRKGRRKNLIYLESR